jgi:hypothetical protein
VFKAVGIGAWLLLPLANVSATYSRDIANSPLLSALTFREGGNTRLTVSRNYDLLDRLTN